VNGRPGLSIYPLVAAGIADERFFTEEPAIDHCVQIRPRTLPSSLLQKLAVTGARHPPLLPKLPQDRLRAQERPTLSAQVGGVAAPSILIQTRDQTRADRIQVKVPHKLQKIRIPVTQDRPVAPLEQMSARLVRSVEVAAMAVEEALHDLRQRAALYLDQQVEVVGHEHKGVEPEPILLPHLVQAGQEVPSVTI
jgi:hypothetical protein